MHCKSTNPRSKQKYQGRHLLLKVVLSNEDLQTILVSCEPHLHVAQNFIIGQSPRYATLYAPRADLRLPFTAIIVPYITDDGYGNLQSKMYESLLTTLSCHPTDPSMTRSTFVWAGSIALFTSVRRIT